MEENYNKKQIRWEHWDYRWDGVYFITICTKHHSTEFGKIKDGKMELSSKGIIVDILWHELQFHFKGIILDEFVVMPNHIHGIIILKQSIEKPLKINDIDYGMVGQGHALDLPYHDADLLPFLRPDFEKNYRPERFQNIGKNSISAIIGSFKSAVSKHCNRLNLSFQWQPRFHDHIIRNLESFLIIKSYIQNNPSNWENDKFNQTG